MIGRLRSHDNKWVKIVLTSSKLESDALTTVNMNNPGLKTTTGFYFKLGLNFNK